MGGRTDVVDVFVRGYVRARTVTGRKGAHPEELVGRADARIRVAAHQVAVDVFFFFLAPHVSQHNAAIFIKPQKHEDI